MNRDKCLYLTTIFYKFYSSDKHIINPFKGISTTHSVSPEIQNIFNHKC